MRGVLKKSWLLLVILIAGLSVFTLPGCKEEVPTGLSLEEILEKIYKASEEVKSCRLEMDMNMKTETTPEAPQAGALTMNMRTSGAIDQEAKRLRMESEATIKASPPPEGQPETQTMKIATFIIEDTMYAHAEVPGEETKWMKTKLPDGAWEKQNQFEQEIELLKASEVTLLPEEEVDGVSCYVFELKPDLKKMWGMTMSQQGIPQEMKMMPSEEDLEKIVKSFSVKYWIGKDSFLPVRTVVSMGMDLGVATMNIDIRIKFHSYNAPISIELPPEAEEARCQ